MIGWVDGWEDEWEDGWVGVEWKDVWVNGCGMAGR